MGKVLENSGASQEQFVMCCRRIREKKVLNKGKAHSRCNKFYLNNKFSSRMRSVRLGFYGFLFFFGWFSRFFSLEGVRRITSFIVRTPAVATLHKDCGKAFLLAFFCKCK